MQHIPLIKDVLLVGGGHTHALVIRKWAMKPMPGVRLTLVSRDVLTPYSGMLPAFVAGHYTHSETHIDLERLCQWAGVRFINASVSGLQLDPGRAQGQAWLEGRPRIGSIGFDLVSVNTGSTPDTSTVPGAYEFAVPVKPVNRFADKWKKLLERAEQNSSESVSVGVVGAGVGGFELLLSIHHVLSKESKESTQSNSPQLHWFIRGAEPLKGQPARVRSRAIEICRERNIKVHTEFDVKQVEKNRLLSVDGREVSLDEILWVTAAAAPGWPGEAGLNTLGKGFIEVNEHLQSTSHPGVFACGDVASQQHQNTPKAGVFAVRQAPVLFENLRRALLGESLKTYQPQKNYLSLISLGEPSAIASRNGIVLEGAWVWRWKDWIDVQFMQKFSALKKREMQTPTIKDIPPALGNKEKSTEDYIFCGGCGAKVGPEVLASVLSELRTELKPQQSPSIVSMDSDSANQSLASDSCVIEPGNRRIVQSVDQLRANISDPYLFGRIAALHALSDVYASNGLPDSALALVTLPFSEAEVQGRDLRLMMSGAVAELDAAGCMLAGGHSSVGPESMLGFVVNGFERNLVSEFAGEFAEPKAGDALILSKPLGTGVIMAAHMRHEASGLDVASAIDVMLQSNREAAEVFHKHGASCVTDVTGFGLIGHALNLLDRINNELRLRINLTDVPVLSAALELSAQNFQSSLLAQNTHYLQRTTSQVPASAKARERLLLDPQTSGGLLAVVPQSDGDACLQALRENHSEAMIIGNVELVLASDDSSSAIVIC